MGLIAIVTLCYFASDVLSTEAFFLFFIAFQLNWHLKTYFQKHNMYVWVICVTACDFILCVYTPVYHLKTSRDIQP